MADQNELLLEQQKLEINREIVGLKGRIKDTEEELKEIIAGSTIEAQKELELIKLRFAESTKQLELEKLSLIEKQNAGTATQQEIEKIQELNGLIEESGKIARKNAKDQENRIKLLQKEDQHNDHIRKNVLGIVKADETRRVKLSEIKKVIETTPPEDLKATLYSNIAEAAGYMAKKVFDAAMAFDQLSTKINAATNTSGEFNSVLAAGAYSMGRFGVNGEKMGESLISLRQNFSEMSNMSVQAQGDLAGFAAKMAVAGISTDTTSKFLNTATKSMGMGVQQVQKYEKELFAFSKANGISMKSIDAGLAQVMPRLTAFGKDAPKIFKDLALQAKQMGMEMDKVLNITEGFTTFEGAAEAAGELNSMLGGNMIDSLELLRASSEDPAKAMQMVRDAMNSTGKSFEDFSGQQKRAFAMALKTDPETLSKIMSKTSEAAKEAAMNEEQFNDALAKFVPIGEKMQAVFAKMAPVISKIGEFLAWVMDLFVQLIDIPVVGWVILGVGALLTLGGVLLGLGVGLMFIIGQLILTGAGLWELVAGAGAATTAVATTGTATAVAGAEMAAGAQAASVGMLAALSEFILGLGGLGAISTALLPLLLPLAAVVLAIGFAFFLTGAGIALVLLGVVGVILALGQLMKILIEGGAATLTAAIGFAIMAGSLYLLAGALAALGTLGAIGIGVLLVLTALILSLGISFALIGEGMERAEKGIKAFADFDITKLESIKNMLSLMADQMERLSNAAVAFSMAMSNPMMLPVMTAFAVTKQATESATAAIPKTTTAAAGKEGSADNSQVVKIVIDSPIMLDNKKVGKFVYDTMRRIQRSGDELLTTESEVSTFTGGTTTA